jgi:hypothetical protein
MRRRLRSINLIRFFLLVILVVSLISAIVDVLSFLQAPSAPREGAYVTVYSRDITLVFSSSNQSYVAGDKAQFDIDIINMRDFPISQVNFSLNVKSLPLFGVNVFSIQGQSKRTFLPGRIERMQILPARTVEVSLPEFTPPGYYALELSVKAIASNPPTDASIVVYVAPSVSAMTSIISALAPSSILYALLTLGSRVDIENLPENSKLRRLALFTYLIEAKSTESTAALQRTIVDLSIGQKFVLLGLCTLIVTVFPFILRFENIAGDLSMLAYFSLLIGVLNILWETRMKTGILRLNSSIRITISLITLAFLTYFTSRILALTILAFTLYVAVLIRRSKAL